MFLRVPPDEVSLFASTESVSLPDLGTQDPAALEGWKGLRQPDGRWQAVEQIQGKEEMSAPLAPASLSQHSVCPDGSGLSE